MHINALERNNNKKRFLITSTSQNSSNFFEDLYYAFVFSNIPMRKLCNPVLKQFLEKYTKQNIPNESTLRKNYIPNICKNVIEKIANNIIMFT